MTKKRAVKKSASKKPAPKKPAPAAIDVTIAAQAWPRAVRNVAAVCRRAAQAALDACALRREVEVSILLTTDAAVKKLNAVFRGKDQPTNVLSFPAADDTDGFAPPGEPVMLGDIAVAYGVCAREAKAENKTLTAHLSHLTIHGVLHLLGYDHEKEREAGIMEQWERTILARLGIADPYADTVPEQPRRATPKTAPRKRRSAR